MTEIRRGTKGRDVLESYNIYIKTFGKMNRRHSIIFYCLKEADRLMQDTAFSIKACKIVY